MSGDDEESASLEFTPTWVVAVVCFIIILISLCAARSLHKLGKWLEKKKEDVPLFQALEKLKEELMLLGFISLLLTVFQEAISHICIPSHLVFSMLPCKVTSSHTEDSLQAKGIRRQLLSADVGSANCSKEKSPLLSLEALHQLHIFIFVLAVVHVIFCVITKVLGGARISQWKSWENSVRNRSRSDKVDREDSHTRHNKIFRESRAAFAYWRKSAVVGWLISFFKQFYNSISKSDYIALRQGFIAAHCPGYLEFNFHEYMMQAVITDFRRVIGISWFLWLFVVIYLLLNVGGWHTYFWLAFLPLILLLLVGAKLEHIITRMAQDLDQDRVHPSDDYFWFNSPATVLHLIHFILFQNSFEIAFFVWVWCTYGFHSCIMEELAFIIPRIIIGVIVQFLCSYSTLPLYAIVSQMGSEFRSDLLNVMIKDNRKLSMQDSIDETKSEMQKMTREPYKHVGVAEPMVAIEAATNSIIELPFATDRPLPSP